MSDKTCGNCGHVCYGIFHVVCPKQRYEGQEEYDRGHYMQNTLDEACDRYIEREGTLEQRYEQLEQVAKKMLKHIGWCLSHYSVPWSGYYKEFKDELRECGVSLDD